MKYLFVVIFCFLTASIVNSQSSKSPKKIRSSIDEPMFYSSDPLSITVGEKSEALRLLNKENKAELTLEFRKNLNSTSVESNFVLAILLYDMGNKHEALYWHEIASIRLSLLHKSLDSEKNKDMSSDEFKFISALKSLDRKSGQYIYSKTIGTWHNDYYEYILDLNNRLFKEIDRITHFKLLYPEFDFNKTIQFEDLKNLHKVSNTKARTYLVDYKYQFVKNTDK